MQHIRIFRAVYLSVGVLISFSVSKGGHKTNFWVVVCVAVLQRLSLLHNFIQQSLNSGLNLDPDMSEICNAEDL